MTYNIESLKNAYIAGEKFRFLFFWRPTPSSDGSITESCFSQWWMEPFTVEDVTYSCAEQYMMAEKARLFHDSEMLQAILSAEHPKKMKDLGRSVQNFQKDIWDECCKEIVIKGNLAKFSQSPALLDYLRLTKKRVLVEASPRDRIWGIGMGKSNPCVENPLNWRGKNLLGFALMEVRDKLLFNETEALKG